MAGLQTIVLRKNASADVDQLAPGEYVPLPRASTYGGSALVGWCCPTCAQPLLLLRSVHTVDFDGVVSPGVNCPDSDCSFSGHMQLADWVPEPVGYA